MRKVETSQSVCVVIPAYNEEVTIGSVVKNIKSELSKEPFRFEIVVIDDGSKDNTAEIARQNGAVVVEHVLNSGAGAATATGLSYADLNGFTFAITVDADGQHDVQDVAKGITISAQSGIDLLIGSRLINSDGMSKVKILGNRGLSFITYLLFGVNVTDSQSGLRVFSQKALKSLKWRTSGYEFCSEMLWRAKQLNLTIDEYPIKAIYSDYSRSKGQNNWNAFNIVKSLLQRRLGELFHD